MNEAKHPQTGYGAPRRSVTAPIPTPPSHNAASSDALIETLYQHQNAKIVAFTASGRAFVRGELPDLNSESSGSLPSSSSTERTIAVGSFRIYRARGSVAFLNCGHALQPILPKSQCWCIDEVGSRFILQIRKPTYWRIELPVTTPEDISASLGFRKTLDSVLQFEKTACPFQRSFTVDLPDQPESPAKKRPWAPRPSLPDSVIDLSVPLDTQPFKPRAIWEDTRPPTQAQPSSPRSPGSEIAPEDFEGQPPISGGNLVAHENESPQKSQEPFVVAAVEAINATTAGQDPTLFTGIAQLPLAGHEPQGREGSKGHLDTTIITISEDMLHRNGKPGMPRTPSPSSRTRLTPAKSRSVSAGELMTATHNEGESLVEQTISTEGDSNADDQVHEGSGSQGSLRKAKLRRTTGFSLRKGRSSPSPRIKASEIFVSPPSPSTRVPVGETRPHSVEGEGVNKEEENKQDAQQSPQAVPKASGEHSRSLSHDSFHSVESWPAETPQSPSPRANPILMSPDQSPLSSVRQRLVVKKREQKNHSRGSLADFARGMPGSWYDGFEEQSPDRSTGTSSDEMNRVTRRSLDDNDGEAISSRLQVPPQVIQRRKSADSLVISKPRAVSPRPQATTTNLFTLGTGRRGSEYASRLGAVGKLPLTIIAKTAGVLLSPPGHLMILMLKVAARIISGQWKGQVYGYDHNGEAIPVQWDYSEGDFSDWSDDEDDDVASVRERRASFRNEGEDE